MKDSIKRRRSELDLTMLEVAKRLGVSEGTVWHIIVGIMQPSLAMLTEIAKIMNCKLDELVRTEET